MENFGKFMVAVLMMIITAIINGFVFSRLWYWFIVPTFQVNPLRTVEAIGIIFLINFIRAKRDNDSAKYEGEFWEYLFQQFSFDLILASFALFSGWILKLFF